MVGQESKTKTKAECKGAEPVARTAGWNAAVTTCLTTEADGRSAGVTVAARVRVGMAKLTRLNAPGTSMSLAAST